MLRRVGGSWIRSAFRVVVAAVPLLLSICAPARADEPPSRPRPNEVCLFTSINFEGLSSCVATGIGNAAIALILNDRISSIRVGSAASIEVCNETFFGGWCQLFRSDVAELPHEQNNAISSYRVMTPAMADAVLVAEVPIGVAGTTTPIPNNPATAPDTGQMVPVAAIIAPVMAPPPPVAEAIAAPAGVPQICFFAEPNFGGEGFCASPKDMVSDVPPQWDDRISSIRVEGKVAVQVCQSRDFFGWCERIETSLAQLPAGRNDAISSYRLQ